MPRKRGKYRAYTQTNLETAMFKVQNRECSMRRASLDYGIPRTTLFDKLTGNTPLITTQGPSPVLTYTEERKLAQWLKNMSRIGYGQTRQQLKIMVKKILDEDGRHNPFKNNTPGNDWFRRFKKRHPGLTERLGESLGKERAMLSVKKLDKWFTDLETYLDEEGGGVDIMANPTRIFNCDESGFPLNGKTMKVLAPTGCRTVYQLTNSDKSQITVLACMNAAGTYVPPMLIFPGQRFKYDPLRGSPDDWVLGRSESGWIDQEVFYEWVANHFLPSVRRANIELPVILFLDGHRSHLNLETANFCAENQVILYCFPAHASHILQPCDLSLFKSLKNNWKKQVQQWQVDNPGQNVTKQNFASIFYHAWKDSAFTTTARNGFKAAGLYPFTKAFDHAKVAPSEVFKPQEEVESDDDGMPILSPVRIYDFDEEDGDDPDRNLRLSQAGFQSPVRQRNSHAAGLARKALESTFTPEKLWVYEKRHREGFEVDTDELYSTWRKLKLLETNQSPRPCRNAVSPSRNAVLTSTYVSPCLDQYLRYPKAPESRRPVKVRKELPKAISGLRYRKYLEDKQTAKEDLEKTKREKREIREAKKHEKDRILKEKQRKMQEKKNQKKRLPVCRKLLADTPVEIPTETVEAGERDVYGVVTMDYDEYPGDDDVTSPEENEQHNYSTLLGNTVVSLELDGGLIFPQPSVKKHPSAVLLDQEVSAMEESEKQARDTKTNNQQQVKLDLCTSEPQQEEYDTNDHDEVIDDNEQMDIPSSRNENEVTEPPVIKLGPLLPLTGDSRNVIRAEDEMMPEKELPSLEKMVQGTSPLVDDVDLQTTEGDIHTVDEGEVVMTTDGVDETVTSVSDADSDGFVQTGCEDAGAALVIVEGAKEQTNLVSEEEPPTASSEITVRRAFVQVTDIFKPTTTFSKDYEETEVTSITPHEEALSSDTAGKDYISGESEELGAPLDVATKAYIQKYCQLPSNVCEPGPSGVVTDGNKRKKERMRMTKKGATKRCHYEEEETLDTQEGDEAWEDDWTQIDEDVCDVCRESYSNNDDDWVGCEWCPRWFHKECTDIADIAGMSEEEINSVDWYCHHCM